MDAQGSEWGSRASACFGTGKLGDRRCNQTEGWAVGGLRLRLIGLRDRGVEVLRGCGAGADGDLDPKLCTVTHEYSIHLSETGPTDSDDAGHNYNPVVLDDAVTRGGYPAMNRGWREWGCGGRDDLMNEYGCSNYPR